MKKAILGSIIFCFIFSLTAQAKDIWEMADSPKYGEKAGGMLGRGIFNAATCFVDIPAQTVNGARKGRPEFVGAVGGFATGCVCTILRAASGVLDVGTFWIPGFHGIPVSRNYDNCLSSPEPTAPAAPAAYVPPTSIYEQPAQAPPTTEGRLKYVKK